MLDTDQTRYNYGEHAVLVNRQGPPFHVVVWLNCQDGNTSMNPRFREIVSARTFTHRERALLYGEGLCRGANEEAHND